MISFNTRLRTVLKAVVWTGFIWMTIGPVRAQDPATLTKPNEVIVENSQLQMRDGFGAQFWITDAERFFFNWVKSDMRTLTPVTSTRRNVPLWVAVFVSDPGEKLIPRPDGRVKRTSDLSYDFQVVTPKGKTLEIAKDITGWMGASPPPHIVQLLWGQLSVHFEVIDEAGEYTMKVVVHDNVKHVDAHLERKIILKD